MNRKDAETKINIDWSIKSLICNNPVVILEIIAKILDYIESYTVEDIIQLADLNKLTECSQAETLMAIQYLTGSINVLNAIWLLKDNIIVPNDIVWEIIKNSSSSYMDKEITNEDVFLALQISVSYYNDNHINQHRK